VRRVRQVLRGSGLIIAATSGLVVVLLAAGIAAGSEVSLGCRQPQLAVDGQHVYLTCGTDDTIYVSASIDGGHTFAPLTKVASMPSLALGMHRGPRIVVSDDALIVTATVGRVGKGQDGDILAWRSGDRGRNWTGPLMINDVAGSAREGLHAMAARGKTIVTAWLDLRNHGTQLYSARSIDGGLTWAPDERIYQSPSGTICQCCHPSLAIAVDGTVLAMFRNVVDGHRDLCLVRGRDGRYGAAEKLGAGTWKFDSCPMDGGGIAVTPDGGIETVWRRDKTVFLTQAADEEIPVADGVNPTIVSSADGPVIAWNGADGLSIARPDRKTVVLDPAGKFAALAATDEGTIAAWERGEQTLMRVLPRSGHATRRSSAP
jgi:hypothetical protein